jgi:hypothetical protein
MYYIYVRIGRKSTNLPQSKQKFAGTPPSFTMVPGPQYGSASLGVSKPLQSVNFFSVIVVIFIVLAIAGWPHGRAVTSVLNSTVAQRRTWYVSFKSQEKASSRSCKTPHNHHHFHQHHNHFCPPCHRQKKLPPIMPPNNDEWPGDHILPLNFISHQHNARPRNGLHQQPQPSFSNKFYITIFRPVSCRYLTWRMASCKTLLLGPCSPCRSFHSVCHIRSSSCLNLLMRASKAPRSTIQETISHPTNFILPPQQKTIPPATQSCLPPPLWPSHSQVAAACLPPPLWPSCRLPAGTTTIAITQATLTPPGSTTGKATGQAICCGPTATSADPATT